jgi:hypothetical protein
LDDSSRDSSSSRRLDFRHDDFELRQDVVEIKARLCGLFGRSLRRRGLVGRHWCFDCRAASRLGRARPAQIHAESDHETQTQAE